MVRNYVKKPKIQNDDEEIKHGLQLINNGASSQVELGLYIIEIYVDQKKVKKIPILKFQ